MPAKHQAEQIQRRTNFRRLRRGLFASRGWLQAILGIVQKVIGANVIVTTAPATRASNLVQEPPQGIERLFVANSSSGGSWGLK